MVSCRTEPLLVGARGIIRERLRKLRGLLLFRMDKPECEHELVSKLVIEGCYCALNGQDC
jgi:hypothetical protein